VVSIGQEDGHSLVTCGLTDSRDSLIVKFSNHQLSVKNVCYGVLVLKINYK